MLGMERPHAAEQGCFLHACRPRRPDAAVIVGARNDAYVSAQSIRELAAHWPGAQVRAHMPACMRACRRLQVCQHFEGCHVPLFHSPAALRCPDHGSSSVDIADGPT